jgi:hypothetical protein
MIDNVFVPQAWRTAGGPYDGPQECEDSCRPHSCTPDACGNYTCTPGDAGEYLTKEDCNDNCDDPTGGQCALDPDDFTASGTGAGARSYFFTVGPAAFENGREICVSYVSTNSRPIRVQIWSPDMASDGCSRIAERIIRGDSQWRGTPQCSCGFNAPGGFKGGPKGFVQWRTKQKNVTTFEVRVLTECADNEWQIGVTCGACAELPDYQCNCDCGTVRPDIGCFRYPFGIDGDVAEAILTIEWCGLTGIPFAAEMGGGKGIVKSIEPSRYASESIIACDKDANGTWFINGTFAVSYGDDALTCATSRWFHYEYAVGLDNDQGGIATVSLIRTVAFGDQPCGCDEVPIVTITIPQ